MIPPLNGTPRTLLPSPPALDIDQVWDGCRDELQTIEQHIQHAIDSSAPIINTAARYLFRSGGKRIRPLLMILAARLCNERGPRERLVLLASSVEYIHAAALLHDDVLDDAAIRRGREAARLLWGNKASILVGDYLYTRAIDQVVRLGNSDIESALADACRQMVEGEMLQQAHRHNLDITEAEYLKIIECKTASLICTACTLGAALGNASISSKAALAQFGRYLGIAFQVADDALDYTATSDTLGKTPGTDFHEGKITLPLLHLLSVCTPEERQAIRHALTSEEFSHQRFPVVVQLMEQYSSVAYALERSRHYMTLAISELRAFPASRHRNEMEIVADYVVSRDH